ncbi:MAG: efflux transporter outer membrane subunit, partial [Gammaproteobacteria bacterium]|nr:efflux transporter outer membrane subunit [Gammaproteobacteria bacterium]
MNAERRTSLAPATAPLAACALGLCMLAACTLEPRRGAPSVPAPAARYQDGEWRSAAPADARPRGPWWRTYADPRLDALEDRVTSSNQDLKASLARLLQARAAQRLASSALYPELTLSAGASRARSSTNAPHFPPNVQPLANDLDLQAGASYELDVFGRIRSAAHEARANAEASAADAATVALATHAELAADYFTLRGLDARIALLDRTVADERKAYALTRNLHRGGAAAATDVAQARVQLETARTAAADARLARAQTEHAIAVLVGANPTGFRLPPRPLRADAAPPPIDPGQPSSLLERRPDVAAAERRVAAANAQIGVARAAWFPVFDLLATAGYQSTRPATWLLAPSRLWSLGGSAALNAFDGGARRAATRAAHAQYEERVADYRNTVISAYQQVEDQLAALEMLDQEALSEHAAADAADTALKQARYRYAAGASTYLEVFSTENADLAARSAVIEIAVRRLVSSVRLVEALGGGWR